MAATLLVSGSILVLSGAVAVKTAVKEEQIRRRIMSESAHHDTSHNWLIFFFVCFGMVMLGIGIWAATNYKVDAVDQAEPAGGHGMILPMDGEYAPHAIRLPIA